MIKINGVSVEDLPEFDNKVVKVEAWYDRHTRDYCIQKLNKEGYQVGDSIRVGTKADRDSVVAEIMKEYFNVEEQA